MEFSSFKGDSEETRMPLAELCAQSQSEADSFWHTHSVREKAVLGSPPLVVAITMSFAAMLSDRGTRLSEC